MPGWILLEQNHSESGSGIYDLRRGGDGVLYCTCRGWLSNKNAHRKMRQEHLPAECKHTKAYVAGTGASYGPQYEAPAIAPKKAPKPSGVPQMQAKPAGTNWKATFLAEQKAAEARGLKTPAAALAEFKEEIGRFANLDVGDVDVQVEAMGSRRALDVE